MHNLTAEGAVTLLVVPFSKPWKVLQPTVFRYMDRRWIDAFFETGALRLSSLARFQRHVDEQRQDQNEGVQSYEYYTPSEPPLFLSTWIHYGMNAYVLCGSMSESGSLATAFGADDYLAIQETMEFANAIAAHIPGFIGGTEGPCLYLNRRLLKRDLGPLSLDHLGLSAEKSDTEKAARFQQFLQQ